MRTCASLSRSQNSLSPYCSLPITGRAAAQIRVGVEPRAAGVVTTARMFWARSQGAPPRSPQPPPAGKQHPRRGADDIGLKRSVTGSHTITACTPAASAPRSRVPRLPGFSIASTTSRNGTVAGVALCAEVGGTAGPAAPCSLRFRVRPRSGERERAVRRRPRWLGPELWPGRRPGVWFGAGMIGPGSATPATSARAAGGDDRSRSASVRATAGRRRAGRRAARGRRPWQNASWVSSNAWAPAATAWAMSAGCLRPGTTQARNTARPGHPGLEGAAQARGSPRSGTRRPRRGSAVAQPHELLHARILEAGDFLGASEGGCPRNTRNDTKGRKD